MKKLANPLVLACIFAAVMVGCTRGPSPAPANATAGAAIDLTSDMTSTPPMNAAPTVVLTFTADASASAVQVPTPTLPQAPSASIEEAGSAVIAYVKDGNLYVWEEATGQSQTIIDSGDVTRVELSGDGQLIAYLRRSFFEAGGYDNNQQAALWVVERDGGNPRELVSAEALRVLINAAETDSTNFPRLEWVPGSHILLYSGDTYAANGMGEGAHTPLKGVYLIDSDSPTNIVLAPAEESLEFAASPDGQQVALVSTTGISFATTDGSYRSKDLLTYPATGIPMPAIPGGVWTQDSSAFLIKGSVVNESPILTKITLWRVPVDGSPAQPVITLHGDGEQPSPDGSVLAYSRWANRGQKEGGEVFGLFFVPLPENLGPLSVHSEGLGLTWSPSGSPYVLEPLRFVGEDRAMEGRELLYALCPNAAQGIEVCGTPVRFGEQLEWLEWVDRDRFLYTTYQPRKLYLGALNRPAALIAEETEWYSALASTCRDDSEFVEDISIPDGTQLAPHTLFRKTWRVRNSGTCTWDSSYRLTYLSGDRLSGPRSAPLGVDVQPGEEIDVSVPLIAPEAPGTYRGQWQMFAPDSTPFGTKPYVQIQVP